MKVILLQSVKNIGQKGEVKEVSEGYFQNFLLPKKLAIIGNEKQLAHIRNQKEKSLEKLESIKESALSIKSKIDGKIVILKEKASDTGRLYRAVNEKIVSQAIEKDLNASIPENKIKILEQIKSIGEHKIQLNLFADVTVHLILNIEAE